MKIKREKLVEILTTVKPGLSKKSIIEQASHFIFTGKEILTYNDRICILYPLESEFSCSIPAEEFYKILTGIHCEDIELTFNNDKLLIAGDHVKANLTIDTGDSIIEKTNSLAFNKALKKKQSLPDNFIEALSLCMFSVSKDETRPELTGVLIEDQYVASTDGIRISEYKMSNSIDDVILIPATSIIELVKFNAKYFYFDKSWAYFIAENNAIFASILIDAEYPDYTKFLKGFDTKEITLPDNMEQIINTSSILAEGNYDLDKEITIRISKNKIECKSQNEKGSILYESKFDYQDNNIEFIINPFCLSKILSYTKSMFYSENKVLFRNKSFKHIIALVSK